MRKILVVRLEEGIEKISLPFVIASLLLATLVGVEVMVNFRGMTFIPADRNLDLGFILNFTAVVLLALVVGLLRNICKRLRKE